MFSERHSKLRCFCYIQKLSYFYFTTLKNVFCHGLRHTTGRNELLSRDSGNRLSGDEVLDTALISQRVLKYSIVFQFEMFPPEHFLVGDSGASSNEMFGEEVAYEVSDDALTTAEADSYWCLSKVHLVLQLKSFMRF